MDKFMLNNAKELFETVCCKSFKRYDLSQEWNLLNKRVDKFKRTIGREPFIYELIPYLFLNIEESIMKKVQSALFQKDKDWFLKIGQYLLYNTYQWIKSFDYRSIDSLKESSRAKFINLWWKKFLEFELNEKDNNKIIDFPKKILLELTNNCNLNCIMCGIGKTGYDPSRDLPIDLLHSLSESVLNNVELIRLNGLGESTIMPNFLEYLNILKNLSAQLEIVTNLTARKMKIWDSLLELNTNFLISCDASSSKLFESIRRGSNFTNFKNNLGYIGRNITNPLQGQLIFTLMDLNIQEITKVVEFAAEMGLGGIIVNVVRTDLQKNGWTCQQFDNIIEQLQKAYDLAEHLDIALKLPDHVGKFPVNKNISNPSCQFSCNNPWEEVYIRYNGDLTVCNMLNPYIYGNCQNAFFDEIWQGINAEMFRTFVNTEYRHIYCKDCYYLL